MPEVSGSPRSGSRGRRSAPGRRLGAALALGCALPLGGLVPAAAEETAATGSVRCQVTDPRLAELSGLVDLGTRMLASGDGGDRVEVAVLDAGCQVVDVRTADLDPYDPEDLALGADGTIWLSDTGDNSHVRATVALLALRPDGSSGLYRLSYPDGAHDAEALLLAPDGTPYVVTKEILGSSGVYRPAGALDAAATVAMERVATVNMTLTGTPGGPVGRAGQLMVTGGAVAGDGSRIALRTYTDAYVWPLVGSDVPGALAGTPVRVPLPEEPQGEAISFTADNQQLLVAGEGAPGNVTVVPVPAGTAPTAAAAPTSPLAALTGPSSTGLSPITSALIAAAVATVAVWIGGKVRRRP
ncbi:hypothetical protein [Blastococcus sp. TF02A-30]|uniref:hypothetical protein n=1 Tax=Blastococcus sp. TF02A-30 TaxID=2250580 RepID=UPI000DEAC887|nr:hypothetical protein [Blastococcus sp. TF02A-30]RBY90964.1 hypothetical protein DQ241_04570 [Blastococcus sp. TF02A-30]